jgi:GH15 family glucan-1,4-alpha-glucosidase
MASRLRSARAPRLRDIGREALTISGAGSVRLHRLWNGCSWRQLDERAHVSVESFEGKHLDAGVLRMAEAGFIDPADSRMVSTMKAIEELLARGTHVLRYEASDDFGVPSTAFTTCLFWCIDALARFGHNEECRNDFEALLGCHNRLGLTSEDLDMETGEGWGNPQTYSMVGIINCVMRLSRSRGKAIWDGW